MHMVLGYNEVRRFLTSISDSEINKLEHDTYVIYKAVREPTPYWW
jgi:hypothetical protein